MISEELLFEYRNIILEPVLQWIKEIGSWKVSDYSGVSKRRINTILKYPQYRKNLSFNDFCRLFAAYQKNAISNKGQNYYNVHTHKSSRFRFHSSRKFGIS